MYHAVSRLPVTTETKIRSQSRACGVCSRQKKKGQVVFRVLRLSPVTVMPSMLHIHSFLHRRRHVILAVDSVVKQQALAAVSDMRNKQ